MYLYGSYIAFSSVVTRFLFQWFNSFSFISHWSDISLVCVCVCVCVCVWCVCGDCRLKAGEPVWRKNRGVEQRNEALLWLREAAEDHLLEGGARGVVYFGDDDNTYDISIFEEVLPNDE